MGTSFECDTRVGPLRLTDRMTVVEWDEPRAMAVRHTGLVSGTGRFLLEAEAQGIASFQQLNDRFMAWTEQVCNTRVHAETGQTPIQRFTSHGPLHAVEPSLLRRGRSEAMGADGVGPT